MTEWEKLLSGQVYNDNAEELFNKRVAAKKLFKKYNSTNDDDLDLRKEILSKLLKNVGENVLIEPDFRCEYGSNISIGDNVYINFGCIILDCAEIKIGNNVLLGPNVGLYAANHALNIERRVAGDCYSKPIIIADNVWIGGDVKIVPGVTIGKGAVVGTGSIVTKDVPENAVAGGNPCRVIKMIE